MPTRKLVAILAATGALTVGSAGAAFAASTGSPSSGSGTTPAASTAKSCGQQQSNRLYVLEQRQSTLSGRLATLQAAGAAAANHPRLAARITKRIGLVEHRQGVVATRIEKLETRCPGLTPVAPTGDAGGQTSPTAPPTTTGTGTSTTA